MAAEVLNISKVVSANTDAEAFGAQAQRQVLESQVKHLLSADAQAERTMRSKGCFSPDEAATLKQAASVGLVKGLLKVEIQDPYSHGRRIEWVGDDSGETWQAFANPIRVGKFATPDKATMTERPPARAFYEAAF
jgi:hypothetical protein